jgi:hypothetical protein
VYPSADLARGLVSSSWIHRADKDVSKHLKHQSFARRHRALNFRLWVIHHWGLIRQKELHRWDGPSRSTSAFCRLSFPTDNVTDNRARAISRSKSEKCFFRICSPFRNVPKNVTRVAQTCALAIKRRVFFQRDEAGRGVAGARRGSSSSDDRAIDIMNAISFAATRRTVRGALLRRGRPGGREGAGGGAAHGWKESGGRG